jgi:HK97 family phage portal protein
VDDYTDVPVGHPLAKLLKTPNPYFTRWTIWYLTGTYLDLTGNSYWWLAKDRLGVPRAIWPLPSQRVKVIPGNPAAGEPIIREYVIDWGSDNRVFIDEADIVHMRHPNPENPYYYGGSLVMKAAKEIDIDTFITEHQRDFFANDATPAGIVTFPTTLQKEVRQAFEQQWMEKFKRKPGEMGVLEGGATYQSITNQKELDYVESAGINRKKVQAVFGVPDSKLMIEEGITAKATLETLDYNFLKETIEPLLTMIDEQLTLDLAIRVYDPTLIVHHESVIPKDVKQQLEVDKAELGMGKVSINEVRERDGYDPIEGGDEPLVSMTLLPLSQAAMPPPEPEEEPEAEEEPAEEEEEAYNKTLNEAQKTRHWRSFERVRARWEKHYTMRLRAYFGKLHKRVQENLAKAPKLEAVTKAGFDVEAIMFDLDEWTNLLLPIATRESIAMIKAGFDDFAETHDLGDAVVWSELHPEVEDGIGKISAKTKTIPRTLHDDLTAEIVAGLEREETRMQLARRVSTFFDGVMDYRSVRIARTNSNYAINKGNAVAAKQSTIFKSKVWITQRDDRVRHGHMALDGVEVPINGKFTDAETREELECPGDPNAAKGKSVINCRCTVFYEKRKKTSLIPGTQKQRKGNWSGRSEQPPVNVTVNIPEIKVPQPPEVRNEITVVESPIRIEPNVETPDVNVVNVPGKNRAKRVVIERNENGRIIGAKVNEEGAE